MIFIETKLKGAYVIELEKREDDRGFFARTFCKNEAFPYDLKTDIVQANMSMSKKKGTLRGMHYQLAPHAETKLIRCTKGSLYDVIIDIRPDSATYKQWFGVELTQENYKMVYVPEGFAHGFVTLEDNTEATYLVTAEYNKDSERAIRYNDQAFSILWPVAVTELSEKDINHPDFTESL